MHDHTLQTSVRALSICLLFTLACRHPAGDTPAASIRDLLPSDTTLAALGRVRIGMTKRELKQARPGVEPAPYVGLREVVRGDTIKYIFRPSDDRLSDESLMPIGAVPEEDAQLMGVDLWHYVPAHEGHGIQRVVEFARSPDAPAASCFRYVHGPASVAGATVVKSGLTIGKLAYSRQTYESVYGRVVAPPLIRTFVAADERLIIHPALTRESVECRSLLNHAPGAQDTQLK